MRTDIFISDREERLDVYVAEKILKTRSAVKKLVDDGLVLVNGKKEKAGKNLKIGDEVSVSVPDLKPLDVKAENVPLDIVYQDEDLAVINKAQGMTVHAGAGVKGTTLVNALLYHLDSLSGINGVIRPGIVHRIDKDTSGLLVVAKNDKAHLSLSEQIKEKTCRRIYLALVEGRMEKDTGTIDAPIGRSDKNRTTMAIREDGRRAVTHYKVLKRYERYSFVEFSLETGRTHQIRVHSKYIGHPIVGDPVYGFKNQKFNLNGQLLHAYRLELTHPTTGERRFFEAPLPDYFQNVLKKLEKKNTESR